MKIIQKLIILIFISGIFISCENDLYEDSQAIGLWQQTSVTEDGNTMTLTPQQASCKLLVEPNGIFRYYHESFKSYNNNNGPTSFYGTWSVLDGTWINFTTDKWQFIPTLSSDSSKVMLSYKSAGVIDTLTSVQKQWAKFHIQSRFTILNLSATEMEIRIKTFVGEKKYALLFAPDPVDFIEIKNPAAGKDAYIPKLVTDQNYWSIRDEYQTLKTYVFKFQKVNY